LINRTSSKNHSSTSIVGKAQIQSNGGYLRIAFPKHLYSGKRKYLSLGLADTKTNRTRAEAKLLEIQRDIDYNEFDATLEKYVPGSKNKVNTSNTQGEEQVEQLTLRQMLEAFETRYFRTRKKNRQSQSTFSHHQEVVIRTFNSKNNLDFYLSKKDIDQAIELTDAGTHLRKDTVASLRVFLKSLKFDYKFESGITKGYEPQERNLPTDAEIVEGWHKIQVEITFDPNYIGNGESWGWILAVIATYGLRPHEVLAIDYQKSFQPPHHCLYIDEKITEGTKTGSRVVYPLPLEWVKLFDIANPKTSYLDKQKDLFLADLDKFSARVAERMRFKKVGFKPYDLRHRYAIRGRELGYQVDNLAKWMGHDLKEHTQTYQKYWSDDSHVIVYEKGLRRMQELTRIPNGILSYNELETLLKKAKLRIAELEAELLDYVH
jgi:integrase